MEPDRRSEQLCAQIMIWEEVPNDFRWWAFPQSACKENPINWISGQWQLGNWTFSRVWERKWARKRLITAPPSTRWAHNDRNEASFVSSPKLITSLSLKNNPFIPSRGERDKIKIKQYVILYHITQPNTHFPYSISLHFSSFSPKPPPRIREFSGYFLILPLPLSNGNNNNIWRCDDA